MHSAEDLQAVFVSGLGLHDGAERVGYLIAVLPVLFRLPWHHKLHAALSRRCTRTPL